MSRSNWKGPYVNEKIFQGMKKTYKKFTVSRSTEILPGFVEQTFTVYDGQKYIEINVTESMVGHKFGEFASTRKRFAFKKKKIKK